MTIFLQLLGVPSGETQECLNAAPVNQTWLSPHVKTAKKVPSRLPPSRGRLLYYHATDDSDVQLKAVYGGDDDTDVDAGDDDDDDEEDLMVRMIQ